jgi:hypothetical protein
MASNVNEIEDGLGLAEVASKYWTKLNAKPLDRSAGVPSAMRAMPKEFPLKAPGRLKVAWIKAPAAGSPE